MAIVVGGLLVWWSILVGAKKIRFEFGIRSIWPFIFLFMVPIIWAAVQTLSLTPLDWHHPLWANAGKILGIDVLGAISLRPVATVSSLIKLLTYGSIFWLSLNFSRDPLRARQVIRTIGIAGIIYATYGLLVEYSGSQTILWFDKYAYKNDLTSTFVNRNSYATYAGLGLICVTGILYNLFSGISGPNVNWRESTRHILESFFPWNWFFVLGWNFLFTALLLTHSRAGFMSTVVGLTVLVSALSFKVFTSRRRAMAISAAPIIIFGGFFAISGEGLDQRLAEALTGQQDLRPLIYERTLEAIKSAPFLGSGYGSFEDVFRIHRSDDIKIFVLRAHSTYLEVILELGLPAALSLFVVFAGMLVLTFQGIRRRRRAVIYPAIGFAATILVATHSIVDFSLQIPAVAYTYAAIMGTACAQSWPSNKARDSW